MTRRALLFVSLFAFGCDDPLAYPQDIDRLRVLGARASVAGDATRAWPAPGESVSLEWLVAAPDPEPLVGFRFDACPSQAASRGSPACAGAPFASAASASPSSQAPRFDFVLPGTASDRVLVQGLVCQDALPPAGGSIEAARCPGEGERVLFELVVAGPGRENLNPSLGDAVFTLAGQLWPEPAAGELDAAMCAPGEPARTARLGEKLELGVALDEADREPLDEPTKLSPPREPLSVSHFATHGRLARPLSVVEGASKELGVSVGWRSPSGPAGERARFYFVVRDGRGGVDFAVRTLCLLP
jgi:hypothetical protein